MMMMKSPKLSDDIISNLPDSLRIHILSFLPTVNAVASCALSTKWKNLWTNLSILSFNDCNPPFRAHRSPPDISRNIKFANFVNRVLHFQTQNPLLNFDFMCFQNAKPYDISTWISVAIMRGVRELNLWIPTGEFIRLPECFFRSVTLEVLRIVGRVKIKAPTLVCLPNLRTMELIRVDYEDAQSLSMLLVSCALLDYLVLDWGSAQDVGTFIVSSSTLRYLRYDADGELEEHRSFHQEGRVINPTHDAHMSRTYLYCMTLEELHLYKVLIQGTFCLPNLRVLRLNCVIFENDQSASSFVSSFSSLESLVVLDPDDISMLKISSSTLRDLRIEFTHDIFDPGLGLVLDTPALQNLSLGSWVLKDVHINDLSSLINALICLDFRQNVHDRSYDNEMCILFHGLQSVKILSLSWMCMEGTIPEHKFPKFPKLTELRVEVQYSAWPLLQQFIKNSNALQDLTLVVNKDFYEETDYGHAISWKDPEIVPECLLSSFQRLYFFGFKGSEDELAMVKYLLKSTKFMQRMVIGIVPSLDDDVKINLLQNLLKFPRRSEECEMTVCFDYSMSWEKVVERR